MKIWHCGLKQFIKIDWNSEETSDLLTNLGLEVEMVEKYQSGKRRIRRNCRWACNCVSNILMQIDTKLLQLILVQVLHCANSLWSSNAASGQRLPV
jgi:hypothetical protein